MSLHSLIRSALFFWLAVVPLSLTTTGSSHAEADEKSDAKLKVTQQETAALKFAKKHHEDLVDLLEELKKSNRKGYEAAIRDLSQTSDRLERLRKSQPNRYESELKLWKLDSKIHLKAARLAASGDAVTAEQKKELKNLLKERIAVRLSFLEEDRKRLANRLDKVNDTIEELRASTDSSLDQDFEKLVRSARSGITQKKAVKSRAK